MIFNKDFSYYTVMPSAKNFETKYKDGVISVFLDKPDYFMIRLDEDDNSVLSVVADYPEYPGDIPTKGDPGVHWIEGWHETESGLYELTEPGAQLYVAPGAVLNARSVVSGEYSRVTGRGLLVDPFQNINKRDMYKLTQNSNVQKLSTIAGSTITPRMWVLYEDDDIKTGENRKVLVINADGETFATVSKTFIDSFEKAVDNLGEDLGEILIASGTSKAGRDYINCEII